VEVRDDVGSMLEKGRGGAGRCPWHASGAATRRDWAAQGGQAGGRQERDCRLFDAGRKKKKQTSIHISSGHSGNFGKMFDAIEAGIGCHGICIGSKAAFGCDFRLQPTPLVSF